MHVCTGCACPCHPEPVRASYKASIPNRARTRKLADAVRSQARAGRGRIHAA